MRPSRKPSPKPPKPSLKHKPKRVSQVDESEHVEHEEYSEKDDNLSSEGDPQVDFSTLAVSHNTIDTRRSVCDSYDESSDESSAPRRGTRRI